MQDGRLAAQDGRPLAFPGEGPGVLELAELERRVKAEGYVLCWSEVLQDFLAVHADDVDPSTIPPGFVPYGDTELRHLFGDDKPALSPRALLRIHAAKKTGARVTGNRPHQRRGPETP